MNEASPELDELIRRAIEARVADVHVSMPGEIVSYSASTQTATVRPCLKRVVFSEDDDQIEEELPPIQNVPVSWPGGSGLTIHGVLAAGDTGDLVFSTNSHNEWQATGRVSAPGDLKPHNLGAAKFYPGIRHKKNAAPDTDNSIGKPGGVRAHFDTAFLRVGPASAAGAQFVALSQATESRLAALETWAAAHVHTSAAPGSPTTPSVPPFVAVATPVAASNLKAHP
jgi:Phage protein Gp138 N-terminal domain